MAESYFMLALFALSAGACQAASAPRAQDGGHRAAAASRAEQYPAASAGFELRAFADPPLTVAPGVRWIWPGGAVDDATIEREVARIAAAGYGRIELQTLVTALSEAEVAADPRIRSVGEPALFARVRTLARAARAHGLDYDLTLGSGWPSGGVGVPPAAQEQQMTWSRLDVTGPAEVDLELPARAPASWVTAPVTQLLSGLGMQISGTLDPARSSRR